MRSAEEPLDLGRWIPDPDEDAWQAIVARTLRGRPLRSLTRELAEGIALPAILPAAERATPVGRSGPWARCQEVRFTSVKAASRALRNDLAGAADRPWIRVDRATKLGVRPDKARESGGRPGLCLLARDDLAGVVRGVDLTNQAIVLEAGANGLGLTGTLVAVAAQAGVASSSLSGCVQGDPLGALMEAGELPRGVDAAFDDLAACVRFASAEAPDLRTVSVNAAPVHEAGGSATQELAVLLASLFETARALDARGLGLDDWLDRVEVRVCLGGDLLLELAKLRALRRLWQRALAACGVSPPTMWMHAHMGERGMARRDPWSNLLRMTQAGFVGAVGGADALTLLPHDHAVGPPSPAARRIARNLHVLLAEESHLDRVEDPVAGSGTLEHLTEAVCADAWARFQRIEASGGLLAALGEGSLQANIEACRAEDERRVRTRQSPLIGVSRYIGPDEVTGSPAETAVQYDRRLHSRWNAASMAQQQRAHHPEVVAALEALREGRPGRVRAAAVAANHGAVLADIAGARPGMSFNAAPLQARRRAAPWESLADRVQGAGAVPTVFLANLGAIASHQARAGFARDLFRAGGFEVVDTDGFVDRAALVSAFGQSGCAVVCICGDDNDYERLVPAVGPGLGAAGARAVLVAGRWPEPPVPWTQAGVWDVVHRGADVLEVLERLADLLEVTP